LFHKKTSANQADISWTLSKALSWALSWTLSWTLSCRDIILSDRIDFG